MAKKEYIYATGKRKSSIARVNIIPGTGKITINKKDMNHPGGKGPHGGPDPQGPMGHGGPGPHGGPGHH